MSEPAGQVDCLLQVNVIIWSTIAQPPGAPITPVLQQRGYGLWSLEQPLPAGLGVRALAQQPGLAFSKNPVPDAVLHHMESNRYSLLECKVASFGPESTNAEQARGLLVACSDLAERLPGVQAGASAEVCYLVPTVDAPRIADTLLVLAEEVASLGYGTHPTGAVGCRVDSDGVYLGSDAPLPGAAGLPRALVPEQRVVAVTAGQDVRPLYWLPWMPDAPPSSLGPFAEKLRQHFLAWLGRIPLGQEQTLQFDELLNAVTRGIFSFWQDRDSIRGLVFPRIQDVLQSLVRRERRVRVGRRAVRVTFLEQEDRDVVMEHVRKAKLPGRLPEAPQLSFLDAEDSE